MTANETLRQLLNERGVEWRKTPHYSSDSIDNETVFRGEGIEWIAHDHLNGRVGLSALRYEITPDQAVEATLGRKVTGETSDGYHTFNDLYHHRAVLFSVIVRDHQELAWKSKEHHDGTMYDGMFIVGIETPEGQATYHYDIDPYWDMFDCKELDRAPEWDGHTPDEAIERIGKLATLGRGTCRKVRAWEDDPRGGGGWVLVCSECDEILANDGEDGEFDGPNYCPNCGRRVVG